MAAQVFTIEDALTACGVLNDTNNLVFNGLIPMSSAAISMSLIDIHERPILPLRILTAINDKITTILKTTIYLTWVVAVGPVTTISNTFLTGTSIAPESL